MSPIYKRDRIEVEAAGHAHRPATAAATSAAPQKAARLIVVGGVPRGIEFTCSCGERSVIEIEFEPSGSAGQGSEPHHA